MAGAGNDHLDGGYGSGDGNDVLYGGSGSDTFIRHKSFHSPDDDDRFMDYSSYYDSIDVNWHL